MRYLNHAIIALLVFVFSIFSQNKLNAQTYCVPSYTFGCTSTDYIRSVSTTGALTNISNLNTNCAFTNGISLYLSQIMSVNPGMTVNFSLVNNPTWGEYYTIWVDWNDDGDFVDAGEQVTPFTYVVGNATYNGSFTVPLSATPGQTRMRVQCVFSTTTFTACGSYTFGEIEDYTVDISSPCPVKPASLPAINISSMAATIRWNAVPGALKYDYIVDSVIAGAPITAMGTTVAGTSANVFGLKPNSMHYARVRSYCTATGFSQWDTISFMTLPPCTVPSGFIASNTDSNSTDVQWTLQTNVQQYQYLIDTFRSAPALSNPNIKNSPLSFHHIDNLLEGRWWYIHVRSKCVANDSSGWMLDSFYVPTPCRKPVLQVSYLSPNNSVVSWGPVKTAVNYEYFFGKTAPALGTPIIFTSVQTPYLQPNTEYTVYVRCNCSDNNIKTSSGWASVDFTSNPPASVNGTVGSNNAISIYPNPAKDKIVVENKAGFSKDALVEVFDITGKKVIATTTPSGSIVEINVKHLSSGMYMLKLNNDGNAQTVRFDKQ